MEKQNSIKEKKTRPDMIGNSWNVGRIPWNKDLTKETDEKIMNSSNKRKGQKIWSEEEKENMKGKNSNSSKYLKNKTYVEIYGVDGAKKQKEKREEHYKYLRQSATIDLKGKTYEEIYGPEKAKEQKEKRRLKTKEKYDNGTATFGFPKDGSMKIKRANQIFPIQDTKIEVKIQNFLKELKIEFYTHQYMHILHGYQCDISIPIQDKMIQKTIIECDGDWWHGNTNHPRYKILTDKQKIQIEKDKIRTEELRTKGFRVIRLWEMDINKLNLKEFEKLCYETTN